MIRTALASDAPGMADLAAQRRKDYARAQPQFWREADGAVEAQRRWFMQMIDDQKTLTLIAEQAGELVGLLIATLVDPPPVYNPGGPTGFVDDFVVAAPEHWPTEGHELLTAARAWLTEHGAAQIVVVAGYHDKPKRALLDSMALNLATTWHVGSLANPTAESP